VRVPAQAHAVGTAGPVLVLQRRPTTMILAGLASSDFSERYVLSHRFISLSASCVLIVAAFLILQRLLGSSLFLAVHFLADNLAEVFKEIRSVLS
jgi:hypothetical protein